MLYQESVKLIFATSFCVDQVVDIACNLLDVGKYISIGINNLLLVVFKIHSSGAATDVFKQTGIQTWLSTFHTLHLWINKLLWLLGTVEKEKTEVDIYDYYHSLLLLLLPITPNPYCTLEGLDTQNLEGTHIANGRTDRQTDKSTLHIIYMYVFHYCMGHNNVCQQKSKYAYSSVCFFLSKYHT